MVERMRRRRNAVLVGAVVAALLASGAAARVGFKKPTVYSVAPETGCRSTLAYVHYPPGKSGPTRKRIPIPPAPGLKATALANRVIRLDWSLRNVPSTCRPAGVLLSIGRYPQASSDEWLPQTIFVDTHGTLSGSARITWYSFHTKPADVALESSVMRNGARSRTVGVLIRRR